MNNTNDGITIGLGIATDFLNRFDYDKPHFAFLLKQIYKTIAVIGVIDFWYFYSILSLVDTSFIGFAYVLLFSDVRPDGALIVGDSVKFCISLTYGIILLWVLVFMWILLETMGDVL